MVFTCLMVRHVLHVHEQTYHHHHHSSHNIRGHSSSSSSSSSSTDTSFISKSKKVERKQQQRIAQEAFEKHLVQHSVDPRNGHGFDGNDNDDSDSNSQCRAAIVIIRHCEKGKIKEHCNDIGFQRADYIATLFGGDNNDDGSNDVASGVHVIENANQKNTGNDDSDDDDDDDDGDKVHLITSSDAKWPAPSYLYATNPGQRKNTKVRNYREIETIQPLATKLSLPINSKYGMNNKDDLTNELYKLLQNGTLCNKVVLISWKHEDIPRLARSLGCGPDDGCPLEWDGDDFDSTWQLFYSYRVQKYPTKSLAQLKQQQQDTNKDKDSNKRSKNDKDKDDKEEENNSLSSWRDDQKPQWHIAAHVEMEDFDPLKFGNGKFYNKKKKHGHHNHHHHHHHDQV